MASSNETQLQYSLSWRAGWQGLVLRAGGTFFPRAVMIEPANIAGQIRDVFVASDGSIKLGEALDPLPNEVLRGKL